MITVAEALQHIKDQKQSFGNDVIKIAECEGRVLSQTVIADRDLPPYDRVAMDGIAIQSQVLAAGHQAFKIESMGAAGAPQVRLNHPDHCIEIMTGAMLPINTDTVIRYEDLDIKSGIAHVQSEAIVHGQNIHRQGSDVTQGSVLIAPGKVLSSGDIGIMASVGLQEIMVKSLPKTLIISTGDELVEINQKPLPHQIRRSNSHTIASLLKRRGIVADMTHMEDNKAILTDRLKDCLTQYQLIILSGGVSMGKFDYIPEVLESLGVTTQFHRVKQRPGKPLWFGSKGETTLFGLPGNPVSSFACTRKYIYHWLDLCQELEQQKFYAQLATDYTFSPDLHLFLPVSITSGQDGILTAVPYPGNGSGDFANLTNINALMEIPRGKNTFLIGEIYPILQIADF